MADVARPVFHADMQLARRLEATDAWVSVLSAQIHAQLHPESGTVAELIAGGYAVFTGVDSPLTQCIGIGMKGVVTEAELESIEKFFKVRGCQPQIELCPLADPSLIELLSMRQYRISGFNTMLVHPLASEVPGAVTEGAVRVQKCTEAEDEIWADTIMRGFSEHFVVSEENQLILKSLFRRPDSTCLLAWLEGRPAGGGALALHEGIAALYGASTLPSFRRRGVQRAVINALLHVAIEGGCDIAYTLTKPGSASQRNMERQHFRVAYTRVAMIRES